MAAEARRGCGYRKVGGLYMVSGNLSAPCGRLPLELHVCPVCNAGIKQTRAWQWIKPRQLLADAPQCPEDGPFRGSFCGTCPLSPANLPEKAGLLWIGEKFYPEAADFMREANRLGVSRRIPAIPRNFKLGETWVLIAHPRAVTRPARDDEERREWERENGGEPFVPGSAYGLFGGQAVVVRGGIITMFRPSAIELICTESQRQDAKLMEELTHKGITPVFVPDDDPDHKGSVHDDNGGAA